LQVFALNIVCRAFREYSHYDISMLLQFVTNYDFITNRQFITYYIL